MTPFGRSQARAMIGNDVGWALQFFKETRDGSLSASVLTLWSDDYYAEIQATLPAGLEGGVYTLTIEGLTDSHYQVISQQREERERASIVKLYLYWRDVNANIGGYLANMVGLSSLTGGRNIPEEAVVAVLSIQSVTRKAGTRRYETTIQAKERVYTALSRRVSQSICLATLQSALDAVSGLTHIDITLHGLEEQPDSLPADATNFERGNTYRQELEEIAKALEQTNNKYGRGMLLIRDGALHMGLRNFPLDGTSKELTYATGLIETEPIGLLDPDPNSTPRDALSHKPEFRLTLKGRPDIKPGDVVKLDLPPEDTAQTTPGFGDALLGIAGSLLPQVGGELQNPSTFYVNSVQHRLGRSRGFSTVITAVKIPNECQAWDERSPGGSRPSTEPSSASSADSGVQAARAVRQVAESAASARRFADIGEVRTMQTSGRGSEAEPPGQTLTTWRGLGAPDGRRNQANRLSIQRDHPTILPNTPYATPFAWGKCGLVLPRYPGTRLVLLHRNGQANDPIDVGALWEAGHGPDSQAGDWWLILPVDIPEAERATIVDDATPEEHTGKVSQDLIDAAGNRTIEVGELTIRVGKDSLKNAGERPSRSDVAGSVTIEHTKEGSKIVMKPDGSVEIIAKNIKLDASDGNITMSARNVDVQVSGLMDVHG